MDTLDCIKSRRSRRLFIDKPVDDDDITTIIKAAICAPSSRDCQPWHFIVVNDKQQQKALADLKSEENQEHILTAPVSIVVCVDKEKSPHSWAEDGVCATMNILLAAHDLGLGSVYVSGFSRTDEKVIQSVQQVLKLPEYILPITILPIGYYDKNEKLEKKEILDINKVTHENIW